MYSVVAFDVEVESYILNLQTIGKKQLSFIHFSLISSFIFSLISRNLLHLAGSAKLYHILFYDGRNSVLGEAKLVCTYLSQDHLKVS